MVRRGAREVVAAVRDLLLPPACLGCGRPADELCDACRAALGWRPLVGCWRCGERLLHEGAPCLGDHDNLRGLAWHVALLDYRGTGGGMVRRFKLDANAAAGRWLARGMALRVAPRLQGPWRRAVLVPIPLHRHRRRHRGFDQADWLARAVAGRLGARQVDSVLVRRLATRPQGDPRVLSRERNVAQAFDLRSAPRVRGQLVLLVDDVFTSGATARACARVLRQGGAEEVALLTACRS